MAAILAVGSVSFDSFAEEGNGDAGVTPSANVVSYDVINLGDGSLDVTNENGVMTLSQSATSGSMPDTNVSYLVFPATEDKGTLSLNLKVRSYGFGKGSGIFVGAFMPDNGAESRYFMSMGFRNPDQEAGNSLSPYWWKAPSDTKPVNIGNGSPKSTVAADTQYAVNLSWDDAGQMVITASGLSESKTFKASETHADLYDHGAEDGSQYTAGRRFGIAIVGAVAEITDMVYCDSTGQELFNQNNVADEGGDEGGDGTGDGGDTEGGDGTGGGDDTGAEVDPNEPNGFIAAQAKGDITYTFDFSDYQAAIYDLPESVVDEESAKAAKSPLKSGTVGLVTVNAANQAKYENDHGTSGVMDINIAVAGTVKVSVCGCQFSNEKTYTMTSETGTVTPAAQTVTVQNCNDAIDFYYQGEAGSVNFTSTGGYLHKIIVTPVADTDIPDMGGDEEADPNDPDGFKAPAPVREITYNFNFSDTTAKIYDLNGAPVATQGTAMKDAGLVKVNSANQAKYWNDHGISGAADIEIAVAGDCKINIVSCAYSGENDTYTLSSATGTVSDPATQNAKVANDKDPVTYTYTGGAGSIRLTSTNGYIHAIEIVPIIRRENRKIEVWDFAEVQEADTDIYHNNIEPGFWNQSGLIGSGSTNSNAAIEFEYTANSSKTVTIGDLTMRYENGDRLYGEVTGTTFAPYSTMSYEDGYTADGLWYCNGTGGTNRRYVTVDNVEAGDKVVVYMGSHTKEDNLVHFQYQGSDATQDDTAEIGYQEGRKYEFIARCDGSYKIYVDSSTNVKPFWHRVMVMPGAKVSGTIDLASSGITGYGLKFVNNTTEDEITADVAADGSFTASLTPGYEYTAVLTGVVGYGITAESRNVTVPDSAAVEGMSGIKVVVEEKNVQKFSGTFTGFDADVDMTEVKVVLEAAPDSQRENVTFKLAADGKFEAYVESGISYTITMEGVNDYEITGSAEVLLDADEEREVKVARKAVYKVSGSFLGLEDGAEVTSLKFVNMEDGYEYAAAVEGSSYSVSLRNGTYEVEAAVSAGGYSTVSHVVVKDSAVDRDLLFVSSAKVTAIPFVSDIYVGYPGKDNNYSTVREAVRACEAMRLSNGSDRITVHIAPGVYREQIIVNVPYVTFINDEPDREVKLTWYYGVGYEYYSMGSDGYYSEAAAFDKFSKGTAQKWGVAVYIKSGATEFRAENITFESSFNKYVTEEEIADGVAPGGSDAKNYDRTSPTADVTSKEGTERAAALAVEGNRAEFYNCRLISSQDTLYTGNNVNGYFKNCYIEGNTDYIFGGGDFVYDGCELNFFGYSDKENGGYITAAADGSTYGYVFRNCYITGNEDMKVGAGDLGRPWRATATVSYLNTKLEYADIILPRGWNSMSGNQPQNANYAEYNTTAVNGDAVDFSQRAVAVKTENPVPDVSVVFNGWTPVYYQADTDKVALAGELAINAPNEDRLEVGDVLTADFSLAENEYNNVSVIRWYRVAADGTETLVKSGVAQFDRSYTVTAEDKGSHIKVTVLPETVSGYTAAEQTAAHAAVVGEEDTPVPTPTPTPVPGETPTPTPVPGETPTPTPVPGETPTPTPVPGETPTPTPVPGETPTPTPVPDETPTPTPAPAPDTTLIEDMVADAMQKDDVDAIVKEIVEIVKKVEIGNFSAAMQSNENVFRQMTELDRRVQEDKGIRVGIDVADEVGAEVSHSGIGMVGAAVNAENGEAVLKVSKAEQAVVISDQRLTENVQLDIRLTSNGEEITELKVPLTITLPIPRSLLGDRMETLVLLHYAEDGSCETVNFRRNADNTVTFTVTHFSTFVFAKEGTPAGTEDKPSSDADDGEVTEAGVNVVTQAARTGDTSPVVPLSVIAVMALLLSGLTLIYFHKNEKDIK